MSDTEPTGTEPTGGTESTGTEPTGTESTGTEPTGGSADVASPGVADATAGTAGVAAPRSRIRGRWGIVALSALVVLGLDQLSKWWAVRTLAPPPKGEGRIIEVIGSAGFRYAENTGMAFSKGADSGRWIALVVIAITVVMVFAASKATTKLQVVLIGVVIGGALGNLVDRVARATDGLFSGAVVDWIYLEWWPTFNVADAAVVCGGILLVIFGLREPKEAEGPRPPDSLPPSDTPTGADPVSRESV